MELEVPGSWVVLSVLSVCILTWVWKALNWVWLTPRRLERCLRQQGLAGTPYKLLVGDIKESNQMNTKAQSKPISDLSHDIVPRVAPFLEQAISKYGKNCFTWRGPLPNVILMEPELVREILSKINDFPKPQMISQAEVLVSGLVRHEGHKWAKHRSLLNPAYRFDKLKLMLPAFYLSCEKMIKEWKERASTEGCLEVDLWPCFHDLSCNMLARAAFGSSYEVGKKIFLLQQQQVDLALQALKTVYIPGSRFLPTKFNRRLKQIERDMGAMFRGIIEKKEKEMKGGEADADDLLGAYMTLNVKEIQEHGKEAGLTVQEIIDECKAFYLAGENASSVLLTWTMVLLSMHQDWQAKAREEVLQVFGKKKPDFEGLNQLKVVTMILHEVLRLYPPAMMIYRLISHETKLGNWTLPPGVLVTLPIMLIQHDPELWGDDVKEFKPERFSQGVVKATKGQVSLFPFSFGPRTCIGQNFAMLQAKMTLSTTLQNFWFELSPSYTHAPYPSLTLQPQHGAQVILHEI